MVNASTENKQCTFCADNPDRWAISQCVECAKTRFSNISRTGDGWPDAPPQHKPPPRQLELDMDETA